MAIFLTEAAMDADAGAALLATAAGPVIVTRDGEPAFVLLSIDSYTRLTGDSGSLAPMEDR
jgi:PHD/YefM family antitoxin component YafN of YafNO toxin-antitoxin module